VEAFAKLLRSQGRDVETLKNAPGIDEAIEGFKRVVKEQQRIYGTNYRLTPKELQSTSLYKIDEAWILWVRDQGFTIIDMGDPMKRGLSDFLNMEYLYTFD